MNNITKLLNSLIITKNEEFDTPLSYFYAISSHLDTFCDIYRMNPKDTFEGFMNPGCSNCPYSKLTIKTDRNYCSHGIETPDLTYKSVDFYLKSHINRINRLK